MCSLSHIPVTDNIKHLVEPEALKSVILQITREILVKLWYYKLKLIEKEG